MSRKIIISLVVFVALISATVYLQQKKALAPSVSNEISESTTEDVQAVDESKTTIEDIDADLSEVPNDSPDTFMVDIDEDVVLLQEN
ncbi:MAG: hypothetical protein WC052_02595 [Patescibacteria group bacterium]|jgi:hypothetical protein